LGEVALPAVAALLGTVLAWAALTEVTGVYLDESCIPIFKTRKSRMTNNTAQTAPSRRSPFRSNLYRRPEPGSLRIVLKVGSEDEVSELWSSSTHLRTGSGLG
jgi:hypothetical protein